MDTGIYLHISPSANRHQNTDYCFHPLTGYIDKTGTDGGVMKNVLEPWMWISTNTRQSKREDDKSWFPGGFIANLTMILLPHNVDKRDEHTHGVLQCVICLEVLLQQFKDM
jgi:hypothetical protein